MGDLGRKKEWLFIEQRSSSNYFRGAGEQTHSFGKFQSPAQVVKKINLKHLALMEKPPSRFIF